MVMGIDFLLFNSCRKRTSQCGIKKNAPESSPGYLFSWVEPVLSRWMKSTEVEAVVQEAPCREDL